MNNIVISGHIDGDNEDGDDGDEDGGKGELCGCSDLYKRVVSILS